MRIDDLLRPRHSLIVGAETQRKHEVLLALGLKDVVLRVHGLAGEGVGIAATGADPQ